MADVPGGALGAGGVSGMDHVKVAIVGAGPAGLYAGRELEDLYQVKSVRLLEAHAQPGGRVAGAGPEVVAWKAVDLGAEFVHGNANRFMALVEDAGLPIRRVCTWAQGDVREIVLSARASVWQGSRVEACVLAQLWPRDTPCLLSPLHRSLGRGHRSGWRVERSGTTWDPRAR